MVAEDAISLPKYLTTGFLNVMHPSLGLLLLFPLEVFARGSHGGDGDFRLLVGLVAVFGVGWALYTIKTDTWRMLGGLLILLTGVAMVIQLMMFLLG